MRRRGMVTGAVKRERYGVSYILGEGMGLGYERQQENQKKERHL